MSHDGGLAPQIRPVKGAADQRAAFALFRSAMLGLPDLGQIEPEAEARYLDTGIGLAAWEGDSLRAVTNGYASEIALPGGAWLPHLAVTHVGAATGATRRGFARGLLTAQLEEARRAGFALAGLRASDARIYGRFGYGIASWSVSHELDLTRTGLVAAAPEESLRLVDPLADLPLLRRIAGADPAPRPASLRRWPAWWEMQEFRLRHAPGPHHAVVTGPPGAERGFLRFHTEADGPWFTAAERRVVIDDLVAHDAAAWRALIHYLFSRDILHRVIFPSRPEDDPLPLLLDNPRALQISGRRDESWIRILDPQAVLARLPLKEAAPLDLILTDPVFADNNRKIRLGAPGETRLQPVGIAISDLSGWIFGAVTGADLLAAGRLTGNLESVNEFDSFHPGGPKPWSGISF